jgi:hypothetical protein
MNIRFLNYTFCIRGHRFHDVALAEKGMLFGFTTAVQKSGYLFIKVVAVRAFIYRKNKLGVHIVARKQIRQKIA